MKMTTERALFILHQRCKNNTETKEALEFLKKSVTTQKEINDVLEQIRNEIQDAYNDNKECGQEDVAYGLKIALDIIEECR